MTVVPVALLLVDFQNDFCAGGALAVTGAEEIIEPVKQLIKQFDFVVATQDWHPPDHCSFRQQGGPWPPHCRQHTTGAALHSAINHEAIDLVVRKGEHPTRDPYSNFEGHAVDGRSLDTILRDRGVATLYVAGLATDFCVRATVLDALQLGYTVFVCTDAVAAVDVKPGDGAHALAEMAAHGARLIHSRNVSAASVTVS